MVAGGTVAYYFCCCVVVINVLGGHNSPESHAIASVEDLLADVEIALVALMQGRLGYVFILVLAG